MALFSFPLPLPQNHLVPQVAPQLGDLRAGGLRALGRGPLRFGVQLYTLTSVTLPHPDPVRPLAGARQPVWQRPVSNRVLTKSTNSCSDDDHDDEPPDFC